MTETRLHAAVYVIDHENNCDIIQVQDLLPPQTLWSRANGREESSDSHRSGLEPGRADKNGFADDD